MSERKRINISVAPGVYDKIQQLKTRFGYKTACEMVLAMIHILIDRLEDADKRRFDLPDDDGAFIDEMFEELSHYERTPDGTVPVRHNNRQRI